MPAPESPSATEIPLTRQGKEKLLQQMYSLPHWIAIIRLFGYQVMPMDHARQEIKPIADEFGKDPVANACEALVEIRNQDKEPFVRLKAHIRRMAFQILGPEPTPGTVNPPVTAALGDRQPEANTPIADAAPATPSRQAEVATPPTSEKRKKKKPAAPSAPPPSAPANRSSTDGPSVLMQQYRAAKEKHPDMLLLFRNVAK